MSDDPCSSTRRSFHSLLAQSYSLFQIIDTITSFRKRRRALSERSESKGKEKLSERSESKETSRETIEKKLNKKQGRQALFILKKIC